MTSAQPTTLDPQHPLPSPNRRTAGEQLVALGWEINASRHRAVHLAAAFDDEREWFHQGLRGPGQWIARELQIHHSTASEWVRIGHALSFLPLTDAAFAANEISYAKAQILTRWANADNEAELLDLARDRPAGRLTTAIAKALADGDDETDTDRDARHHEDRSLTSYTDGDGMTIIRLRLPPAMAKVILAIIEALVRQIANTPATPPSAALPPSTLPSGDPAPPEPSGPFTDGLGPPSVTNPPALVTPSETTPFANGAHLAPTLAELARRWQPQPDDIHGWRFPSLAQQRADALCALFLGLDVQLTTEVVFHVRGDGNTLDDGTPVTNHAIARLLDGSFLRGLIHEVDGSPIDATDRRRHPTTRQRRVAMEAHNHECVDCQSTDILELDHNPPYEQTRHTVTTELEPRCAPCHRAHHRYLESQLTNEDDQASKPEMPLVHPGQRAGSDH